MSGWYKTHMHMHTSFEYYASMRSHAAQAVKYGIDAMFITDHDVRMNHFRDGIEHFRLQSEGDAFINGTGWHTSQNTPCRAVPYEDGYALILLPQQTAYFDSKGKRHQTSLLADVLCEMDFCLPEGMSLLIDMILSLNERQEMRHLYYRIGDCPAPDGAWVIDLPAQCGDVHVTLPVSDDILRFDKFGQDNCFASIGLTVFGEGTAYCRGFDTSRKYVAEAVRTRQKELAQRISEAFGVRLYPATEISLKSLGRESHHLSLSDYVPVINYEDVNYAWDAENALAYVRSFGGTFAINHPLAKFKRGYEKDTREQRLALIEEVVREYVAADCYGAQLIETGFPEGRYGFTYEEQLTVADRLAMAGYKLTQYGDSDNHNSMHGWADGNNFAAWIYADENSREALEQGLRSGKVFSADPVRWKGTLEAFAVGDTSMGEIAETETDSVMLLNAEFSGLTEELLCRVMVSGECICTLPMNGETCCVRTYLKKGSGILSPVRLELIAKTDGRCVLQTNPIFLREKAK